MKRLVITVLALVTCFSLAACGEKESAVKNYPIQSSSSYLDEAVSMPEIVFTTTGEENGLAGSVFYFDGKVTDSGNSYNTDYVIIETENGEIFLSDMYNYLYETLGENTFNYMVAEDEADYTLPAVGETVHVIATYGGFSGVFELPALHLGANPFVVESYREENPAFNEDEVTKANKGSKSNKPDFFSDKERQKTYKELYTSYQYAELLTYLNTYITENDPSDTDSVYKILEYVKPAAEVLPNCTVNYDDFDDKYTINYNGNTEISADTCVIATVSDTTLKATFGFVKTDWLFFDRATVKFSDDLKTTYSPKSYDTQRDVLGGSTIRESISYNLNSEETDKYSNAESVTIRFENKDSGETLDHVLSQTEKDAVAAMGTLYSTYKNCRDLLFKWNNA